MKKERFGSYYGGYTIVNNLDRNSIVYSCGIGDDATFDLAIIEKFGCTVFAFDPTPESIEWVESQEWPDGFFFNAVGVGAKTQVRALYNNPRGTISCSFVDRGSDSFSVPVISIDDAAHVFGHNKIDLLKMDIEGAEYEIIDNFPKIPIAQIVLEFHHFFSEIDIERTKRAIKKVCEMGYKIFQASNGGRYCGFIKC